MSRRTFLKQSGLLAGAAFLHQNFAYAMPENQQKIRLGIIGFGDRGAGIRGVVLQLPELFELKTVCDVLDFRLERTKRYTGKNVVKATKDYREILSDKEIDAVIISTTLSEHFPIAKAALEAGKHVYLEKTMTYNKEEAFELLDLSVNKYPHLIVQVGHQY
ncbi:twin-arginine translocation signal domain-containing protein, partial [Pseudoxanthomonas sp. SGD-10]